MVPEWCSSLSRLIFSRPSWPPPSLSLPAASPPSETCCMVHHDYCRYGIHSASSSASAAFPPPLHFLCMRRMYVCVVPVQLVCISALRFCSVFTFLLHAMPCHPLNCAATPRSSKSRPPKSPSGCVFVALELSCLAWRSIDYGVHTTW